MLRVQGNTRSTFHPYQIICVIILLLAKQQQMLQRRTELLYTTDYGVSREPYYTANFAINNISSSLKRVASHNPQRRGPEFDFGVDFLLDELPTKTKESHPLWKVSCIWCGSSTFRGSFLPQWQNGNLFTYSLIRSPRSLLSLCRGGLLISEVSRSSAPYLWKQSVQVQMKRSWGWHLGRRNYVLR